MTVEPASTLRTARGSCSAGRRARAGRSVSRACMAPGPRSSASPRPAARPGARRAAGGERDRPGSGVADLPREPPSSERARRARGRGVGVRPRRLVQRRAGERPTLAVRQQAVAVVAARVGRVRGTGRPRTPTWFIGTTVWLVFVTTYVYVTFCGACPLVIEAVLSIEMRRVGDGEADVLDDAGEVRSAARDVQGPDGVACAAPTSRRRRGYDVRFGPILPDLRMDGNGWQIVDVDDERRLVALGRRSRSAGGSRCSRP